MLQEDNLQLGTAMLFCHLASLEVTEQIFACVEGGSGRFLYEKMGEPHLWTFVDSNGVACQLETRQAPEYADWVWTVEHLRCQMYLELPIQFGNSTCYVALVMQGPVGPSDTCGNLELHSSMYWPVRWQ